MPGRTAQAAEAGGAASVVPDADLPRDDMGPVLKELPKLPQGSHASLSGRVANGATRGLYGGSGDIRVCAPDQLAAFLTDPANRAKGEAWADAQGIAVEDIPSFVKHLTPTRLRYDTRITNHGFRNGKATPHQSILQAGTAVLVDARGVPRAKCNCGNPLNEPSGSGSGALDVNEVAENPRDAWDGFDPNQVVRVEPADHDLPQITLMDYRTGNLVNRPTGSSGNRDRPVRRGDPVCGSLGVSRSCGGSGKLPPNPDPAPAEAVRAYVTAIRNSDCRTVFGALLSDHTLSLFGVTRNQMLNDCTGMTENLPNTFASLTIRTLVVRSQDDHEAEVVVTMGVNDGSATRSVFVIREAGRWRIDFRIQKA